MTHTGPTTERHPQGNPREIRIAGTERVFSRPKLLFVLLLPLAMSLMAVSSINVALPAIEVGLGATEADIQWVLSGYALAFGIALIPSGRLGDATGRGTMFILGSVLFATASLLSGFAPTPLALNLARLMQGVGAGMFNPQLAGMIQQYFRGMDRARAFAMMGMAVSVSVAIGPVLSGAIIEGAGADWGWRASLLINFPLGLLAVLLALRWLPMESERARRAARRARRAARARGERLPARGARTDLDPVGAVLIGLAVLAVLWPFISRSGPAVWALLPVGFALVGLWVLWERAYLARRHEPMVDLRLFSIASFTNGTAVAGTLFLGSTSLFVVLAIYLQQGHHASALAAGLITLPNAVASALSSYWAGGRMLRIGRRLLVWALALMALGVVATIAVSWLMELAGVSLWWLAIPVAAIGLGMGVVGAANQTFTLQDVPHTQGGTASGVKMTAERIGTAIGNAMVTAVMFVLVARSTWELAFTGSYLLILLMLLISLALAIRDARVSAGGPSPA